MNRSTPILLSAFALLAALPSMAFGQSYSIRALSLDGLTNGSPSDIAGGYIVGNASTDTANYAGLWGPNGSQVLGPVEGGYVHGVYGVNRLGVAVGAGGAANSGRQAMVWRNGVPELLPSQGMLQNPAAVGINDAGTIIGNAGTGFGINGYVYREGAITVLRGLTEGAAFESTRARAINGSGLIAGSAGSGETGNVSHAVVWDQDGAVRVIAGVNDYSAASGINDLGLAVGSTPDAEGMGSFAFMNDGTTTTFLPTLAGRVGASAEGVSNAGLIVGSSNDENYVYTATLWRDGAAYDLNSLLGPAGNGWTLEGATGISDDGTIVGFGSYQGEYRMFALTPVPEPASLAALGLGLAAFARRRRKV